MNLVACKKMDKLARIRLETAYSMSLALNSDQRKPSTLFLHFAFSLIGHRSFSHSDPKYT